MISSSSFNSSESDSISQYVFFLGIDTNRLEESVKDTVKKLSSTKLSRSVHHRQLKNGKEKRKVRSFLKHLRMLKAHEHVTEIIII